jgi:hypothetical protein
MQASEAWSRTRYWHATCNVARRHGADGTHGTPSQKGSPPIPNRARPSPRHAAPDARRSPTNQSGVPCVPSAPCRLATLQVACQYRVRLQASLACMRGFPYGDAATDEALRYAPARICAPCLGAPAVLGTRPRSFPPHFPPCRRNGLDAAPTRPNAADRAAQGRPPPRRPSRRRSRRHR